MNLFRTILGSALATLTLATPAVADQSGIVEYEYGAPVAGQTSTAYPKGDFTAHLVAADGQGEACDWGWGAGGSPFRTGPGCCDNWRVGPRWTSSVNAVFLFRDEIDLAALAAGATAGGVAIDPTAAGTLAGNLEHGAGARISLAGYWPQCKGYELQLSYFGVFGWDANAFDPNVPYSGPLPSPGAVVTQKDLQFESALHSFEVNAVRQSERAIKAYGGFRYVLLGEDVSDLLDESSQPPLIPPNAGAAIAGDPPLDVTDILRKMSVDNNLVGFQLGAKTDFLSIGKRFYVEGFANGGVYCNFIQRRSVFTETRTYNALNDPSTTVDESVNSVSSTSAGYKADRVRAAFVGEAVLGGVLQINNCTKARIGYQALVVSGVELGDQAFTGVTPTSSDLFVHGWYTGVEYRR